MGGNIQLLRELGLKGSDSSESEDEGEFKLPIKEESSQKFSSSVEMSMVKPSPQLNIVNNQNQMDKKKKFSIWTEVLMEQELSEDLSRSLKMRKDPKTDRDVENYDYRRRRRDKHSKKGRKEEKKTNVHSNGTSAKSLSMRVKVFLPKSDSGSGDGCSTVVDRQIELTPSSGQSKSSDGGVRDIAQNIATLKLHQEKKRKRKKKNKRSKKDAALPSKEEIVATQIKSKLHEPKKHLIQKTIEVIGCDEALKLCNETLDVESTGGMLTIDGSRRRTPGGVFFSLVRANPRLTDQQKDLIFGAENEQRKKLKKKYEKRASCTASSAATASSSVDPEVTVKVEQVEELVKNFTLSSQ